MSTEGFNKYTIGRDIVLNSQNYYDAQQKIERYIKQKKTGDEGFYYKKNRLWEEHQFLFLAQLIEFRTADFIGNLYRRKKIRSEYLKKLKNNKKIISNKISKPNEIFSPYTLLVVLGMNLGELINIIERQSINFKGKQSLIKKLNFFKKQRNIFIHHSLSSYTKIEMVFNKGMKIGKEILQKFDSIPDSAIKEIKKQNKK